MTTETKNDSQTITFQRLIDEMAELIKGTLHLEFTNEESKTLFAKLANSKYLEEWVIDSLKFPPDLAIPKLDNAFKTVEEDQEKILSYYKLLQELDEISGNVAIVLLLSEEDAKKQPDSYQLEKVNLNSPIINYVGDWYWM